MFRDYMINNDNFSTNSYMSSVCALKYDQIIQLWKFMNDTSVLDSLKKLLLSPDDYIISLKYYPFNLPVEKEGIYPVNYYLSLCGINSNDTIGKEVKINKLITHKGSSITNASFYFERLTTIDMNNILVNNNFLDYEPYTSAKLYLPYLGVVDLKLSNFKDYKYLSIFIGIDFVTGIGKYYLIRNKNNIETDTTTQNYDGILETTYDVKLGIEIPLNKNGFGNSIDNITMSAVKNAIAFGTGMIGFSTETSIASTIKKPNEKFARLARIDTEKGELSSNLVNSTLSSLGKVNAQQTSLFNDDVSLNTLLSKKIHIYIRRCKPTINYTSEYLRLYGKPLSRIYRLNEFKNKGYVKIGKIHLENIPNATSSEIESIEALLYNGVIL